jgi:hypothetical protein
MAYTVAKKISVFGDLRTVILDVTADAATQTVETGLKYVDGFSVGNKSGCSGWRIYANSNASGVLSAGVIGISNAASGDQCFIVCYGR